MKARKTAISRPSAPPTRRDRTAYYSLIYEAMIETKGKQVVCATKDEAIAKARQVAASTHSEVIVHKGGGRITCVDETREKRE